MDRIKEIVLKPRETWETIRTEEATIGGLFKSYLLILAGAPALAFLLGLSIVGVPKKLFENHHYKLGEALLIAIVLYAVTVFLIWLLGKVISQIAPNFGSDRNDVNGFKVAVYTFTPFLTAGITMIIPQFGVVVILLAGLYGLFILYIGLPIVMGTPKEKSLPYSIVIMTAIVLIHIILSMVAFGILKAFAS
jgi:hypothetical protein